MQAINRQPRRVPDGARSTSSATASNKPGCIAWCSSKPRHSSSRLRPRLAPTCLAELAELAALGVPGDNVRLQTVPGALEIPLALQALADTDEFDALFALGCIIRGESHQFELVANERGAGVTRVTLDSGLPAANAILTVESEAQAWARAEDEGSDAARVSVELANLMDPLP